MHTATQPYHLPLFAPPPSCCARRVSFEALRMLSCVRARLCALLTPDYELLARVVPGAYNRSACHNSFSISS